ncbi:MAG: hypothetical protein KatS3mg104_1688 [Phycisphaerae bacterium]|nr:MAG: hypothetical protein KatS3mg104_1688 [Phycisphaerae bacterium]
MHQARHMGIGIILLMWAIVVSQAHGESWTVRLSTAVQNQSLAELIHPLSEDLSRSVLDEKTPPEKLIELSAAYRFAVFFSRAPISDDLDKACLLWLVQHPRLMQTLCLALGPTERPDAVLSVLRALYRTDRETMADWPDLVTALVVVWDEPRRESSDDPAARGDWAVQLYDYYTRNNRRLRYDLRSMPWNLQIYVVDLVISREEMIWAWDRYNQRGDVGGFYFDVPYDKAAFYQGEDKKIDALAYTLDNLQKHGGICTDQAYYATQIGRLLGVPTVTIIGQGGAGQVAHAWVGYLARQGKKNRLGSDFRTISRANVLDRTGRRPSNQTKHFRIRNVTFRRASKYHVGSTVAGTVTGTGLGFVRTRSSSGNRTTVIESLSGQPRNLVETG